MIAFEEALAIIRGACRLLPPVWMPAGRSAGFALASDLRAPVALPRFDNSAVDGYAVRAASTDEGRPTLPLHGTVRAGDSRSLRLAPGAAMRIMTGAPLPRGADAVVMQEDTDVRDGRVELLRSPAAGENVRRAGEEFRKGDPVLRAGTLVTPPVEALLATLGVVSLRVRRKPRVVLLVTGNELVPAGKRPGPGRIPDANTAGLKAALLAMGMPVAGALRAKDGRAAVTRALRTALGRADVVIASGGISVGDTDHVRGACAGLGVRQAFWKVAVKPGKPVYFGLRGKQLVFGLPGNPVSAMVCFHLFVRPALLQMMGCTPPGLTAVRASLTHGLSKKPGRTEFVRGVLAGSASGEFRVTPVRGQDSHMVGGLAEANALIVVPAEAARLEAEESVLVAPTQWSIV
jgi:molybdopterin molybdotransferase